MPINQRTIWVNSFLYTLISHSSGRTRTSFTFPTPILPKTRTFVDVMRALLQICRFHLILGVLHSLLRSGLHPDVFVYTTAVRSFCELKDLASARHVISHMEGEGVPYNVLIHGLYKRGRVMEAVEVKNSLCNNDLNADEVTYCTIVLGLRNAGEVGDALEMLKEMIGRGLVPNKADAQLLLATGASAGR